MAYFNRHGWLPYGFVEFLCRPVLKLAMDSRVGFYIFEYVYWWEGLP
jgi:hypothetical protein